MLRPQLRGVTAGAQAPVPVNVSVKIRLGAARDSGERCYNVMFVA